MKNGEIWKWVLLVVAILALFMRADIGLVILAICLFLYFKLRKKQEQEEKRKQEELAKEKRERELEAERLRKEQKAKFEAECALYKEDAERGKPEAMRNLGNIYSKYMEWDDAKYWYEKAAERNDVEALFALIKGYVSFGTSQAKVRADQMASNPYASEEDKHRAVSLKEEVVRYEYKQKEEMERKRQIQEQKRREEEAYQAWKQKERQTPVTGDYFRPYSGGVTCSNKGASCRYCARRRWYPGGWGDDDCRIGM